LSCYLKFFHAGNLIVLLALPNFISQNEKQQEGRASTSQ
jgi:hypothetical protein